ncbi:MAG TPA: energy transducer TonB [Flavisolibacter sp.]|jgi:hypothetical protein|nr:energy transducer TonB [Flavisolibacter sp.]
MRRWLLVLLALPQFAAGQESLRTASALPIPKRLETQSISLKAEAGNRMNANFHAEGKSFFLRLSGTGISAHTINTEDPVIFLLQNDSTVTLKSTAVQGFDDMDTERSYKHEYVVQQQDLEMLSRSNVQAVRKYSVIGFDDFYLDATAAANLRSLSIGFLQTLDKERLLKKVIITEPSFPGGKEVLLSFLNKNLRHLPVLTGKQQKTAIVQFRIDDEGRMDQIQVKQSAGTVYDTELLRILKRMPLWKPGLADGSPIQHNASLQVTFYQATDKIRVSLQ